MRRIILLNKCCTWYVTQSSTSQKRLVVVLFHATLFLYDENHKFYHRPVLKNNNVDIFNLGDLLMFLNNFLHLFSAILLVHY